MELGCGTLFGGTLDRLDGMGEAGAPVVVCNEEHRFFAAAALQTRGLSADLILEPQGRNTAPAIALAAFAALGGAEGAEAVLLVLPSDHDIQPAERFQSAVRAGLKALAAQPELLLTFGVTPSRPETGFGYLIKGEALEQSGYTVERFVEKPDREAAEALLEHGGCAWNSGMFLFRAKAYLDALRRFEPGIFAACQGAWEGRQRDADFIRPDAAAFAAAPAISIDYAVMERAGKVGMVELTAAWTDLGSWEAFYEAAPHDDAGNAVQGDVLTLDAADCYLHATHRLIGAIGVRNIAVVETADAVLVVDRARTQDVKVLLERLKASGRSEADTHVRVFRPWGSYEVISVSERYQVKKITVQPGAALSLQLHHHRAEHWVVVRGTAKVTIEDNDSFVSEDESVYIPLGARHRLENPGRIPLELIEVQSGSYLGEDDILRFEDRYGRKSGVGDNAAKG